MKPDTFFDLPELLDVLGTHLPQGTLYRCIQVSKTWHASFIPHLWRTFSEDPTQRPQRYPGLESAIRDQINNPQNLDWYKDVYRRHAKYIRHLTIITPTFLDVCLEGEFKQLRSELCLENVSTGSSGTTTTKPTSTAAAAASDTGGSLMTNLEYLGLNVPKSAIEYYFPIRVEGGSFDHNSGFGSTGFGSSLFGANTTNNTTNNTGDNNSNSTVNATNSTAVTTATAAPPPPPDREKAFVKACQRLVLNNPRLRTLYSVYSNKILQDLEGDGGAVLRSLKNLSCVATDGLIPVALPPSVTHLKLENGLDFRWTPHYYTSRDPGTSALVHEGLESLEMAYIASGAELKGLLAQAPSLKTLSIERFVSNFGFGPPFATTAPVPLEISWPVSQITILKCRQTQRAFTVASGFDNFLACFPLLVEYHDDVWSPAAGAQLVEHCPLLEVIRIKQVTYASNAFGAVTKPQPQPRPKGSPVNDSVSIMLSSLSRLRVLDIPYEAIKAGNVLETPWVCLDLEEFRCQIAEVPFLTDKEEQQVQEIRRREAGATGSIQRYLRTNEEDALMALSERCVHTREAIIAQLSKLTSLRVLSLSPDFKEGNSLFAHRRYATRIYKSERDGRSYIRYDDVMPDTLYFRLNYGLGKLASLTKLEYLSFESTDHRIESADIEWFASHLPSLKEIRGLVTENHIGMEPDPKNDALVALIRRLRPDVIQKQSFSGYSVYLSKATRTPSQLCRYR
ncbi:MAG: hypothetical protein JOS17DRAFT_814187 [Linnemannia elongata]|nr:MAG: hypothetical protein JOS17DRAFT_814187 [Linnemannia elongata]